MRRNGKKKKRQTSYYKKRSSREDYWTDIAMRAIVAVIGFFIALVAQSFVIKGVIIVILSWHAFIAPTVFAIIVFYFPDILNRWFGEQNVSTLSAVKEAEKKQRNNP